jgi:hypothetical protein
MTMADQPDTTNQSGPETAPGDGVPAATRSRLRLPKLALAVRLPALKLPGALRLTALKGPQAPWRRWSWRRPHFGRPSLPDLILSVGAASLVLSIVYVLTGPARQILDGRSREATVLANAATLQLAVESFAAGNLGRYPADVRELLPYLPTGEAPRNPFTGDKTLFRGAVGDLTYRPGTGGGYIIEAWGPGAARPRRLGTLKGQASADTH